MNQVVLIGNLGVDPEVGNIQGDKVFAKFSVATQDGWGDNEEVNWHRIIVWGKQAENCGKYLSKGSKVAITGRIKYGSYDKDGGKVYTTEIVANRVEFLTFKEKADESKDDDVPF